jgi:hypothetical protein
VNEYGYTGFDLSCSKKYKDIIELLTDKLNRIGDDIYNKV